MLEYIRKKKKACFSLTYDDMNEKIIISENQHLLDYFDFES